MAVITYKTTKDYEKNPIVWSLISFAAGFCVQIILPGFILFFIALAATVGGSSTQAIENHIPFTTIAIVCIILSLAAGFLIIRQIAKIPEEENLPPVPPSNFN